jgi:very-short-patch-repair endonuclease
MVKEASFKTVSPDRYGLLKEYARVNRREMTESEELLWNVLRKNIRNYRFRRQHPIGDYIADFVCLPIRLVIEVDGGSHNTPEQQTEDQWRTEFLESRGYRVLRINNEEVAADAKEVLRIIKCEIEKIENCDE